MTARTMRISTNVIPCPEGRWAWAMRSRVSASATPSRSWQGRSLGWRGDAARDPEGESPISELSTGVRPTLEARSGGRRRLVAALAEELHERALAVGLHGEPVAGAAHGEDLLLLLAADGRDEDPAGAELALTGQEQSSSHALQFDD